MSRFIRPDVRTLTISDGDTLVVRARLTAGEYHAALARMYFVGVDGPTSKINPVAVKMATITAYLLDWSLRDDQARTVPIRDLPVADLERTLDQLDLESFDEIFLTIDAHQKAVVAEIAAQKKTRPGVTPSSLTSSSPPTSAGVTNGSGTSMSTSMPY